MNENITNGICAGVDVDVCRTSDCVGGDVKHCLVELWIVFIFYAGKRAGELDHWD